MHLVARKGTHKFTFKQSANCTGVSPQVITDELATDFLLLPSSSFRSIYF